MVTSTARQRVLELIGRRGAASAAQIGRSLSMSPAAVRHHLGILLRDGRIVLQRVERRAARGRPEKIYRLSDRLLGENLAGLSDALLRAWLDGMPPSSRDEALRSLGEGLGQAAGAVDEALAPSRRLVQLTDKLNALNYQARWEAGARGPRVLLGHCPYAAIIGRHPELCLVDAAFLEALVGAPVQQVARMNDQPGGPTHCVFALEERGPRSRG